MNKQNIRWMTFLPAFLVLVGLIILSIVQTESFVSTLSAINSWIVGNLGWAASIIALVTTILACVSAFTKFGNVRIGGDKATPDMSTFSWFTIVLTTTMAAGILFWGPGGPIEFFSNPPTELYGIEANTAQSMKFAMEAMFLHWTIVPYAIYTVPSVVFAFMYYNAKKPFSIASEMSPLLGKHAYKPRVMQIIDAITLFSIGAGMSGAIGMAMLNISGGISNMTGLVIDETALLFISLAIGVVVVCTAISGVTKGMKLIADINVYGYIFFLVFLLVFSNSQFMFGIATEGMGGFLGTFFERVLMVGTAADSDWPQLWTTFHWFSWMAWAPTTGAFMGRIAYGRKVKHMIGMYVGVCASVSAVWITIVSGSALWAQKSGAADLVAALEQGVEYVPYAIFESLPMSQVIVPVFVVLVFLSIITACNSNVISMAGISTSGISPDRPDPPKMLKLIWGCVIIGLSYMLVSIIGLTSVKIIANFGGMFASIIMVGAVVSLIKLNLNFEKYDATQEDFVDTVFEEIPCEK